MGVLIPLVWILGFSFTAILVAYYWRAPRHHRFYKVPRWWLWGRWLWDALVRARVPLLIVGYSALTVLVPFDAVFALGMLVAAAAGIMGLSAAILSRPSFLIPPALRRGEVHRAQAEN
jgi:hypothetical protein